MIKFLEGNRLGVIEFRSQREINEAIQKKTVQEFEELKKRVAAIKSNDTFGDRPKISNS